jgi:hypothetical protein
LSPNIIPLNQHCAVWQDKEICCYFFLSYSVTALTTKYVIESVLKNMWEMQTHILITTVDGTRQHGRLGCILAFVEKGVCCVQLCFVDTHTVSCTVNIMICTAGVGDDLHSQTCCQCIVQNFKDLILKLLILHTWLFKFILYVWIIWWPLACHCKDLHDYIIKLVK